MISEPLSGVTISVLVTHSTQLNWNFFESIFFIFYYDFFCQFIKNIYMCFSNYTSRIEICILQMKFFMMVLPVQRYCRNYCHFLIIEIHNWIEFMLCSSYGPNWIEKIGRNEILYQIVVCRCVANMKQGGIIVYTLFD